MKNNQNQLRNRTPHTDVRRSLLLWMARPPEEDVQWFGVVVLSAFLQSASAWVA